MRGLEFWQEKLKKTNNLIWKLELEVRHSESVVDSYKNDRLKKLGGHALNRDYDGYKIHHRRKKWLNNRISWLTKYHGNLREVNRLKTTKVCFYAAKIRELGGIPKDNWGQEIKDNS